jgi:MFS family permease
MQPAAQATTGSPNHPLAVRMGVIAFITQNIVIGLTMGHFGVLASSVQQRLQIPLAQASAGPLLIIVGSSLTAPFVGVLLARHSLRLMLFIGGLLTAGGFYLLAFTANYPLFLLAYLCFGVAMSLSGSIGPSTLVTRWFNQNRGLALGMVNLPLAIALVPLVLFWVVEQEGYFVAYLSMALLATVVLITATLLAIDHPPGGETPAPEPDSLRTADGSFTVAQLLARPAFWALCIAAIASMTSSVLLGSLVVPMGVSWGFSTGQSALIQSIMSAVGLIGSILFGWVADRVGGARTVAIIAFDCGILWLLLLLDLPFAAVALVIGLIGMHGAGAIPGIGRGISDAFGQASFSRGFGINTMMALPFMAVALVGAPAVYGATGSFAPALIAMAVYFGLAAVLALYASKSTRTARAD